MSIYNGWTLEIDAGPLPAPIKVDIASTIDSEPSLLARVVRPVYTIRDAAGNVLWVQASTGKPMRFEWMLWVALLTLIIFWIARAMR